jgi:integrating conjugative element protein (TIGR03758 family)
MRGFHVVAAVIAATSTPTYAACNHPDFLRGLATLESRVNPAARNRYGYVGLFQMGEAAFKDAGFYQGDPTRANDWTGSWTGVHGVRSLQDFHARPDAQVKAVVAYHNAVRAQIRQLGLDRSIGTTVNGVAVSLSGLVAGAHLVGVGNLKSLIDSRGGTVPRDGNGTSVTAYMSALGGCEVDTEAPSFATVAAAQGVGSVAVGPRTPSLTAELPDTRPTARPPSTDEAFATATGRTAADLREAIATIAATLLLLWVAWTSQSNFFAWCKRRTTFYAMKADIVRSCIVLCVVLVILQ